ncbi:MAG TPA: ATP phosphoribosyltransferase regulatory subunit [Thermoanaerobaculia bacterium]|nr:ATP phosphoribosyltransferase regulatory subunit [Thermoanaerobaculia bacterium]
MRVSAALPTGVAALLFESARQRREAEERLTARLREAGYSEVILPILDYLEPYESLLTPATRAELYRFIDRDGELLALRADFTPMLARLLAPRLESLELPLRLFYRGDVIRYQEERAGRAREFYQLGAELLGVPGEPAELEALRLFLELAVDAGGDSLQIVLGFAGALDRLLLGAGVADPVRLAEAVARRERGEVRQACQTLLEVVENGVPDRPEELGPEAAGRLRSLLALREQLASSFPGLLLSIDLAEFACNTLHPDLAVTEGRRPYYDGLVFNAYAGPAAVPVGGGGRYDRLFRALGAEVPAVGFSLSLERLMEARR